MNTLANVPRTKKLDRRYVDHVAGILRPIINERFDGNTTAFAKALGVSQPQVSQIVKVGGGDRGIGIVVLIAIREYLGDITLDELLGLEPPGLVKLSLVEEIITRALTRRATKGESNDESPTDKPAPVRRGVRKRDE